MSHVPQPPPTDGDSPGPADDATSAPGTVVIPAWASGDWWFAARVAGLGHVLLLVVAAAITALHVIREIALVGLDAIEWGPTLLTPLFIVLGWAGGGAGSPVLVTAAVYLVVVYALVCRRSPEVASIVADRTRTFAAAVKVGAVAGFGVLVVGILVNMLAERALALAFTPNLGNRVDLTSLLFTSWVLGAIAALLALVIAGRTTLAGLLGLTLEIPIAVRSGVVGGRRTLLIAGLGLLLLATLGSVLDSLTQAGTTLGSVLATMIGAVIDLALRGLDHALLLLLGASKFLHEGGFVWASPDSVAGWMWLSLPVLLAAYLAGGVTAAKFGGPRSRAEAAKCALLVGPTVAAVSLLVAIGWAGQPFLDDLVPIAILLPTLWGGVAVAGAWLWANQQGLPSGLVVERPDQPDVAETDAPQPSTAAAPPPVEPTTAADPPPAQASAGSESSPPRDEAVPVAEPTPPAEPPQPPAAPTQAEPEHVAPAPEPEPAPPASAYDDGGFVPPPAVRLREEPTQPLPSTETEKTVPLGSPPERETSSPTTEPTPSAEPGEPPAPPQHADGAADQWWEPIEERDDQQAPPRRSHDPQADQTPQQVSDEDLQQFAPPDPGSRRIADD